MNFRQFKSGTDIRAVASEGVQGEPVMLTDEVVEAVTGGFILWLCEKNDKKSNELKMAVGHDSRISADRISAAVIRTMIRSGVTVLNSKLSSTPAMFMITLDHALDGAVQITASHHPFNRNGLKFFTPEGGLDSPDLDRIIEHCEKGECPARCDGGSVSDIDYMTEYAAFLRKLICERINAENYARPLEGYKIAVDAGNGAGGFYAHDVLEILGADVSASRYLEPDGMFPNHIPNPENKTAMASIREATLEGGCDIGVIFDTDVDRAGAVDGSGEEINRNRLIGLAAAIALENDKGGTIVTDSTTSLGLKRFIENSLGGKHYRYRRGYRNVIGKAIELNSKGISCPIAIETSGHAAMRENHFLDDGAYLVTLIIIKLVQLRNEGKDLNSLIADMPVPDDEAEIRLKITEPNFKEVGERILENLENRCKNRDDMVIADDNREGIRVYIGESWFLVRLSVHDPILPINLESTEKGGCKRLAKLLLSLLEQEKGVDLSPLYSYGE